MSDAKKVIAIVGSYRKGGVIDKAVDEILAAAKQADAEVEKIYLVDKHIEFCTNCRACTQEPGPARGQCATADEMRSILDAIERSDALVLASPMNFFTVTAVTKRFIERLLCFVYWPWGSNFPKVRSRRREKAAVVVASSAAPALLARLVTRMVGLLKNCARMLGARRVDVLFIGFAARDPRQDLSASVRKKARRLGKQLALRG